jgi:hypothetical protein
VTVTDPTAPADAAALTDAPPQADGTPPALPAKKAPAKKARARKPAAAATPGVVEVVYIGVHCEVFLPSLDNLVAVRGVPVKVAASDAGHAPKGEPGDKGYDPGSGLLAQVDNWTKAGTKAAKDAPPPNDTPATDAAAEGAPWS